MKKLLFILQSLSILVWISAAGQVNNASSFKLFRFGPKGKEKPAVEYPDGRRLDVSGFAADYNEAFFAGDGIVKLQQWLESNAAECPAVSSSVRIGSCVARPSKIVGIGLNYRDHAKEAGMNIPAEPIIFLKSSTSLSGPNDAIPVPEHSTKLDWEIELAIVIGKQALGIPEDAAAGHIAGYCVANDVSERSFQLEGTGQWTKGKSFDDFCPLGPYLVPVAQINDVQQLSMSLTLNGQKRQSSNTSQMIFGVNYLVSYVSKFMTLLPGDVIVTGTPAGVGHGSKPPVYLSVGDELILGIDQLGSQEQKVVPFIETKLTQAEYEEYKKWVAIGVGGLPHTLEGYRRLQTLNQKLSNPLDLTHVTPQIGMQGDIKTLKNLPKRTGERPAIAPFAIPHRQLDQHNNEEIRKKQKEAFDKVINQSKNLVQFQKSYFEKHNDAVFLIDSAKGNQTVVTTTHGEVGHMHPTDGSMHFSLSPSDTKEVLEKGWGELHGLAGQVYKANDALPATYMMVYSPRTEKELGVVTQILKAAIKYSSLQSNTK